MASQNDAPRYFHIVVRPKGDFVAFRTIELGDGLERLEGRRPGSPDDIWEIVAWLIDKACAHNDRGRLVADSPAAQAVLDAVGTLKHVRGDRYKVMNTKASS